MTDWDERYHVGDTPWDKGLPAPPLLELLEHPHHLPWGDGPVLVPGCGAGHDVRALASTGLEVIGLDISARAIGIAGNFPKVGKESYEQGDFLDPEWAKGRCFSAIWEHTCFCAIPPARRGDYARAAASILKPGGVLAGVFFLQPWDPGEEHDGPPHEASIEEIDSWFAPSFERIADWVPTRAFPGREGREWTALFSKVVSPVDCQ